MHSYIRKLRKNIVPSPCSCSGKWQIRGQFLSAINSYNKELKLAIKSTSIDHSLSFPPRFFSSYSIRTLRITSKVILRAFPLQVKLCCWVKLHQNNLYTMHRLQTFIKVVLGRSKTKDKNAIQCHSLKLSTQKLCHNLLPAYFPHQKQKNFM